MRRNFEIKYKRQAARIAKNLPKGKQQKYKIKVLFSCSSHAREIAIIDAIGKYNCGQNILCTA